ncbi:hypothetical protein ACFVGM_16240 [Kitasatospora purpeofusca]|uniref:hypothetical protein n=1 Tax=Kitasatospora purpeofusca TaxID=67352 RepID=UPI00368BE597
MGFSIELRRVKSKARTGRSAGATPAVGVVERYAEDGELDAAVRRIGASRLPVLAGLDPYTDHRFQGDSARGLEAELAQVDTAALKPAERKVLDLLLDWSRRCAADPDLRIGFTGD